MWRYKHPEIINPAYPERLGILENPGTPSGYESRQGAGWGDVKKGAERIAIEQYQLGQDVLLLSRPGHG